MDCDWTHQAIIWTLHRIVKTEKFLFLNWTVEKSRIHISQKRENEKHLKFYTDIVQIQFKQVIWIFANKM